MALLVLGVLYTTFVSGQDNNLQIVHFSNGVLTWQVGHGEGYCGLQCSPELGGKWQPVTNAWNLAVTAGEPTMSVSLPELGLDASRHNKMFFRIVWSNSRLALSSSQPEAPTAEKKAPSTLRDRVALREKRLQEISPVLAIDIRSYTLAAALLTEKKKRSVLFTDFLSFLEIREMFAEHGIDIRAADGAVRLDAKFKYPDGNGGIMPVHPFERGSLTTWHPGGNQDAPFENYHLCVQTPEGIIFESKTPISFFGFSIIGNIKYTEAGFTITAYDRAEHPVARYQVEETPPLGTFERVSASAKYLGIIAPAGGFSKILIKPLPLSEPTIVYFSMDTILIQFVK